MASKTEYRIAPTYQTKNGVAFIYKLQKKTWLGWWDCDIVFSDANAAKVYLHNLKELNK